MKRSRAELFSYLGAPLKNVQWSWGAVRKSDGVVFLVVWQDENRPGHPRYSLVHNQDFWGETTSSLGLNERKQHLDYVRQGAKTYMIMAKVTEDTADGETRRIGDLNVDDVFLGGELFEDEQGNIWLERVERISVTKVRDHSTR